MAIKTEYFFAESELQYILYFLVIAFIFTSLKCDEIIYCNYDHHLNFPSCVKSDTVEKIFLYVQWSSTNISII